MEISFEENGVIQTIEFDATISESHESTALVTEHAVESGVSVTDHIRPERARLTAEVLISNTPIRVPQGITGGVSTLSLEGETQVITDTAKVDRTGSVTNATVETKETNTAVQVLQFPQQFDRVGDIHALLIDLKDRGVLLTVYTRLRNYDSMVLSRVSSVRSAKDKTFEIDLIEVRFAETETIAAPDPVDDRGRRRSNRGAQATEETSDEQRSYAAAFVEDILGIGLIHETTPSP